MSKSELDNIIRHINRERLTTLLREAVLNYSPSYAEQPATLVFTSALNRFGIPFHLQHVSKGAGNAPRSNIIVELGPKPTQLLWIGHVDTIALWHGDENRIVQDGDLLYGLGTSDMKGGCAAIIEALTAIQSANIPFKRGLCVGLVVGEEEYGDGSEVLSQTVTAPLTVIGEPTGLIPCVDHYGYLEIELTADGTRAHAALPEIGSNAIYTMLKWVTDLMEELTALPSSKDMAVNLREIRGGTDLFVIPDRCDALLDVHLPPNGQPEEVEAVIEGTLSKIAARSGVKNLRFKRHYWAPGYTNDPNDVRLETLKRAYGKTALTWNPSPFRSHSDASLLRKMGTLPLICGPGLLEVAHTRREHVSLSEVEQAARLYAAMIYEACLA